MMGTLMLKLPFITSQTSRIDIAQRILGTRDDSDADQVAGA